MPELKTKPYRIYERDIAPLRLLAEFEQRSPQDVFHAALAKYIQDSRPQLLELFERTQAAIAAGDIDGLTELLSSSARRRAEDLAKTLPA